MAEEPGLLTVVNGEGNCQRIEPGPEDLLAGEALDFALHGRSDRGALCDDMRGKRNERHEKYRPACHPL
jgi:hypothetical protein